MAIYDVYQHPKTGKYTAMKQGFCWPAFFLVPLWAFSRRLYLLGFFAGGLFFLLLLAEVVASSIGFPINYITTGLRLSAQALLGWFANDILRLFLAKRGFEQCNTIEDWWPSRAIQQHIDISAQ